MPPLLLYTLYALLLPPILSILLYALSALPLPSAISTRLSSLARLLATTLTLFLCAAYGVLASLALRPFHLHRLAQYATARAFGTLMPLTTHIRFLIISGKEHLTAHRPVVIVGNHQSALDILLLAEVFPPYCSVSAKKSLAKVPLLGWFMTLSGTVFIDRGNRESAMKAFSGAAEEIRRERQSVFVFPEGTRKSGEGWVMGGFKKGGFHLAVEAGVEIVPVVAANYFGVADFGKGRLRGGVVPVSVLKPISTKGLVAGDVDDLTKRVRDLMVEEFGRLGETGLGRLAKSKEVDVEEERKLVRLAVEGGGKDGVKRDGERIAVASGVQR